MYTGPRRRSADFQSADKARDEQHWPIDCERASKRGQHVKDSQHSQSFSRAPALPGDSRGHGANDRADQGHGYGETQLPRGQAKLERQRMRGASDDRGVESK